MKNAILNISDARVAAPVKYTPPYTKQGGKPVAAKASIPVMITNPDYTDPVSGERVDGSTTIAFLTAWGKLADTCAKYLPVGKEFSCMCDVNSFQSRLIDDVSKQTVLNAAGQALMTVKHGFTIIPGTFRFGNDSAAQIQKEITEGKRSIGWDGKLEVDKIEAALATGQLQTLLAQAKQGVAAWEQMRAAIKNQVYVPGMAMFGVAEVVQPTDALAIIPAYGQLAGQVAAATEPVVGGFTYKQMVDAGWTDEQMLTHNGGKYASLVPKKAPAPPAVPAPPAAPVVPMAPPMENEAGSTAV